MMMRSGAASRGCFRGPLLLLSPLLQQLQQRLSPWSPQRLQLVAQSPEPLVPSLAQPPQTA